MEPFLAGLVIGLVLGLTGAGAGVLAVPLLVGVLHVPFAGAAPVALAAVGVAATLGAVLAFRRGEVRYRAAGVMALAGVAASHPGLWLAQRLPQPPLLAVFACVLAWVSVTSWRRAAQPDRPAAAAPRDLPCRLNPSTGRLVWTPRSAAVLVLLGASAGTLSGLLGVGGGFVIVPGLQRVSDLPSQGRIGTSLAVVAIVSLWGVAASAALGHLDADLAWRFTAGATAGMLLARSGAARLPPAWAQRAFAVLSACVAVAMALKAAGRF